MCAFSTTTLGSTILDPRKRVRYATGLVLGVDEFQQDQTYLMERDQRHQRALHGYGTVYGLGVRARVRDGEAEVVVEPGLAVDPRGRDICIPAPQCARLDSWLAANADAVAEAAGSFPDALSLYVVLCHQECETDRVPLPGSPCRSEDDAIAPSRIADHFELQLTLEPPIYAEEPAVRRFGRLLRRLHLSDEAPVLSADDLADRVRALATGEGADTGPLHLHPDDAADLIRLAFRVWTVEVRPQLDTEGGCPPPTTDACVLLGQIDLQVVADGDALRVDAAAPAGAEGVPGVEVGQEDRPYLVSTRVLQEWLALLAVPAPGPGPGSFPDEAVLLALNDLIDVEAAPSAGDVLTWDGEAGAWVAAPLPPGGGGGITDHGALSGLDEDDHPQYLTEPRGDARYARLDHSHSFPSLTDLDASGDLDGLYPNPTVVALQGRPIVPDSPVGANPVLRWNGTHWAPFDLPIPEAAPSNFEDRLVRIVATSWEHGGADPLEVEIDGEVLSGVVVAFGLDSPGDGGTVLVREGSLDAQSFQILSEAPDAQHPEFLTYRGIRPDGRFRRRIVPVRLVDITSTPWRVRAAPDDLAEAAYFPISSAALDDLAGARLRVVIHGDLVQDRDGRALDAEFVRGGFPSGDRPDGARLGLQGGRFESWFTFGETEVPPRGRIDVNSATREELMTLAGIGGIRADAILEARARGERFESPTDLTRLAGIPERTVAELQDRILFGR